MLDALLSRRRFLSLLGELVVLIRLWPNHLAFAASRQQSATNAGYGQGGYGQGEYPVQTEHSVFMPIITNKEK